MDTTFYNQLATEFFCADTIFFYLLGLFAFGVSMIDDIAACIKAKKSGRPYKKWYQWMQLMFITLIAISLGISITMIVSEAESWLWIVSIVCGFIGGTILLKIDTRKNEIGDQVVDSVKKKIDSVINKNTTSTDIAALINNPSTNLQDHQLQNHDQILNQQEYSNPTFVDPNQTPYNPFENE